MAIDRDCILVKACILLNEMVVDKKIANAFNVCVFFPFYIITEQGSEEHVHLMILGPRNFYSDGP